MGRKGNRDRSGFPPTDWDSERTMAAAEEEQATAGLGDAPAAGDTACLCGNRELLLEAYLRVVDGALDPTPLEVERLTCPECNREFEAVQGENNRILRGDFIGYADADE